MTFKNKFDGLQPLPEGPPPVEQGSLDLSKGLREDLPAKVMDLGESPSLQDVRFERTGIRKDFGDRALGSQADSDILCIVQHKFIDASSDKHFRLLRLRRLSDGRARTEIWNDSTSAWEIDATTTSQTIEPGYVRGVTIQGVVLFAAQETSPVLIRKESLTYTAEGDDFTAGNSLTGVGDSTSITFSPTDENIENSEVTVNFDVDITISGASTFLTVEVAVYHNGEFVTSKEFTNSSSGVSETFNDESITIVRDFADGDTISLEVESISEAGTTSAESDAFTNPGAPDPRFVANKSTTPEAVGDQYTFTFDLEVADGVTDDVRFYADTGSGFTLIQTVSYTGPINQEVFQVVIIPGMGSGDDFGIGADQVETQFFVSNPQKVTWDEEGSTSFSVHGHNQATDGDSTQGATWSYESGRTVTLEPISGAPDAFWVESFADRAIALRDDGDSQLFSWSADGDVEDWGAGDSGSSALLDTRNDALDDLMACAPLSSDQLAVIRARSIMRAFETGNTQLAVGVVHWLENIGTESPFSVSVTPAGVMFLGFDLMVYVLTEQGPTPVGAKIHEDLIEQITEDLHKVDGEYDAVFQEYWLSAPSVGKVWVFDVGEMIDSGGQRQRWRVKNLTTQRLGTASVL